MKIFHAGFHQFRESLRELLRELWFSYCSSRGMPFREWNFVFRELNFEFRELLREYPGTLPELREWPFHSESVFPEIGVVPTLLNIAYWNKLPWNPFSNPTCIFLLVLLLLLLCYFVWLCVLMFFVFVLLFWLCLMLCFQNLKKHCFLAILFFVYCWFKGYLSDLCFCFFYGWVVLFAFF